MPKICQKSPRVPRGWNPKSSKNTIGSKKSKIPKISERFEKPENFQKYHLFQKVRWDHNSTQVWKAHTRAASTTFPTSSSNHNLTIDYTFLTKKIFFFCQSRITKWKQINCRRTMLGKSAEGKRKCNFSAQTAKWLVLAKAFPRFAQIGTSQIFLLNFSHR